MARMTKRTRRGQIPKRPRRSAEEWRREVERWQSSGQSIQEYTEAHDIHATTLTCWASRFGVSVRSRAGASKQASRNRDGERDSSRFLPVSVVTGTAQREDAGSRPVAPGVIAEFELGGGRRLRLSGLVALEELAELVAALEERLAC